MIYRVTGVPTDEALFESLMTELGKNLDVYDQILSKQKYLAGDVSGFSFM